MQAISRSSAAGQQPPESLVSYVPAWLSRSLEQGTAAPDRPFSQVFPAAILLTDISGFTALAERLSAEGPAGVEELTRRLNEYFGTVIDVVAAHGGDVTKFAGDSLLALWPAEPGADLAAVAQAAIQCGLSLQLAVERLAEEARLSMRIGVGCGDVTVATLGGVRDQWETVVMGSEVAETGEAERRAEPGTVVATPAAWAASGGAFGGTEADGGHVRVDGTLQPVRVVPLGTPVLSPGARRALESYVLRSVQVRMLAGQEAWLGEHRTITSLFLLLPGFCQETPRELAQRVVQGIQACLFRWEATVNKIAVDNKGTAILAAAGLPPLSHEDDASRCVHAALEIRDLLEGLGVRGSVGLATGAVFAGSIGNARRREYTVIGNVVNLSARLMQHADGQILCDQATARAAATRFRFTELPPIAVKGRSAPMPVFRPEERARSERRGRSAIVGRGSELALFEERLESLRGAESGGVILLEGEPGLGKSRLVHELLERAEGAGVRVLFGEGDSVETGTPYFAWRSVLRSVLGRQDEASTSAALLEDLAADPDLLRLAPLLNAILPLGLPENEFTSQLVGQVRADNTELLVGGILARLRQPLLLVLDDAHWLDSASWLMAGALVHRLPNLLLVLATRPLPAEGLAEYRSLVSRPDTLHVVLAPLSPEESVELVRRRLDVKRLPHALEDTLVRKAEGNPFFSEELIEALLQEGVLRVEDGECRLADETGGIRLVEFPSTVQAVVNSRLDRLDPAGQMVVKVASVLGRSFADRELRGIYPIEADVDHLPQHLDRLATLEIVVRDARGHEGAWLFKHAITQEVAYNLMLLGQRQVLHRSVAEWHEAETPGDRSGVYPLLAHHWQRAGVVPRALDYLEKAGAQALFRGANREAVRFLGEATELARLAPTGTQADAQRELSLGYAHRGLGDITAARRHFERGVALLGFPAPQSLPALLAGLVAELVRQAWNRSPLARLPRTSAPAEAPIRKSAAAWHRLSEVYYLANDVLPTLHAGFRALNLAERAGPDHAELAQAQASASLMFSTIPLHGLANSYGDRALRVAEGTPDLRTRVQVGWTVGLQRMVLPKWTQTFELYDKAKSLARDLGDWQNYATTLCAEGYGRYYHGEFEKSVALFQECAAVARQTENRMHEGWGLAGGAGPTLRLGRTERAAELAQEALEIYHSGIFDPTEEVRAYVNLALARLLQGRTPEALEVLARGEDLMRKEVPMPTDYHTLDAYAGIVEIYTTLWEATPSGAEGRRLAGLARKALRDQAAYARVFPWGGPRHLLMQGRVEWLEGRQDRARRTWAKGVQLARELDMPFEEGMCLLEAGRRGDPDSWARGAALLESLGAPVPAPSGA